MESLADVAATGDRLRTLEALRDRLARDIDDPETPARDRASLARQLTAVLAEIASIAPTTKGSPLDELLKRRARNSGAV